MQRLLVIFLFTYLYFQGSCLSAQVLKDSAIVKKTSSADTSKEQSSKKKFNPRTATLRSAILPGWGQIYNKKYWKLPLVYGGLGTTAYVFFYNITTYKLLRQAYILKLDRDPLNDSLIDSRFRQLSAPSIRSNRDLFRQNIDYSVIFFILFWGLNVVDATVDAQLKGFDVNDNLSLQFHPGYSPMANTTGLSLVLDIHSRKPRTGK